MMTLEATEALIKGGDSGGSIRGIAMPLKGTPQRAPAGVQGFDTASPLTATQAAQARAMGFEFCIRYVSRRKGIPKGDLTSAEAQRLLSAGLALMTVQPVSPEGWLPTKDLGIEYGAAAAANAHQVGFPPGVNVWLDLEGIHHAAPAEEVIHYCNAWFDKVDAAGFVPGLYVGANAILSGDELYWRLRTKHYWRSGSAVPDIPHRGYQLVQRIVRGDAPFGVEIDRNVTKNDAFGSAVVWLMPQTDEVAERLSRSHQMG
jgi:hypothetical protein